MKYNEKFERIFNIKYFSKDIYLNLVNDKMIDEEKKTTEDRHFSSFFSKRKKKG
jgi:hypothetical protein